VAVWIIYEALRFLYDLNNRRPLCGGHLIWKMLMIRKGFEVWEMGCVVISEKKIVLDVLEMISIPQMSYLSVECHRFIELKQKSLIETESDTQVESIRRQDFLLI
jgi:hypothetical protein